MKFEYDPAKSESNKRKHGIDFEESAALWLDGKRVEIQAKLGEDSQMRYAVIGLIKGVVHTAIITYKGAIVRIISARPSSEKEKAIYEKTIKKG